MVSPRIGKDATTRGLPPDQLDFGPVSRGGSEFLVARHKRDVQELRERNVRGIVRRDVRPELPDPAQKQLMSEALDRDGEKIVDCLRRALFRHGALECVASYDVRDLEVDQMWCVKRLLSMEHNVPRRP